MIGNRPDQVSQIHSSKERPIQNVNTKFSQKEVNLSETPLFFPEGFEKIFLVIYVISLPYIVGLIFLFFIVSGSNVERFLTVMQDAPFLFTWAIGYEILAALVILWIIKMALNFANESRKPGIQKQFRRP